MKKISKNNSPWQIIVVLLAVLIAIVVYEVHIPLVGIIIKESTGFFEKNSLIKQSETFPDRQNKIEREIKTIDSIYTKIKNQNQNIQKNLVEALYVYADSSGLKTTKVEIGEAQLVKDHKEVTVSIKGTGTYEAIGKFIEKIENAPQPVCVRQVVIKGTEQNLLSATIEFVIIE